jgi:hypothetical protein
MKVFVILSVLAVGAYGARLDNTYIPPASAQSAGGFNLDAPKLALASNVQNSYSAPAGGRQNQYQQQSYQQPGLNQGTFTSVSKGQGYQSVSVGSHSSQGGYQAPQQNYQQQQSYQQPQQSYQPQPQYNQQQAGSGYNAASTTPIPILKCKKKCLVMVLTMKKNMTKQAPKKCVKKEDIMNSPTLSEVTTLNVSKCQKWLRTCSSKLTKLCVRKQIKNKIEIFHDMTIIRGFFRKSKVFKCTIATSRACLRLVIKSL